MNSSLTKLEREVIKITERLRELEEVSVPSAARLFRKPTKWVRKNLPVIIHGPKSHHVKLCDIEAYRQRRTVWPQNGKDSA